MRDTRCRATRPAIGSPERMNLPGAVDTEDITIHRQEYTAIDADATQRVSKVCLLWLVRNSGQAHHVEHLGGLKHRETS